MNVGLLHAQDDIIAAKAMSSWHISYDVTTSEVMQRS